MITITTTAAGEPVEYNLTGRHHLPAAEAKAANWRYEPRHGDNAAADGGRTERM